MKKDQIPKNQVQKYQVKKDKVQKDQVWKYQIQKDEAQKMRLRRTRSEGPDSNRYIYNS